MKVAELLVGATGRVNFEIGLTAFDGTMLKNICSRVAALTFPCYTAANLVTTNGNTR